MTDTVIPNFLRRRPHEERYHRQYDRRQPIRLLLALIPSVGLWGIWWTAGLTWCISAIFCMLRYFFWNRKIRE